MPYGTRVYLSEWCEPADDHPCETCAGPATQALEVEFENGGRRRWHYFCYTDAVAFEKTLDAPPPAEVGWEEEGW